MRVLGPQECQPGLPVMVPEQLESEVLGKALESDRRNPRPDTCVVPRRSQKILPLLIQVLSQPKK